MAAPTALPPAPASHLNYVTAAPPEPSRPSPLLVLLIESRNLHNSASTPDAFAALSMPFLDVPPMDPPSELFPPLFDLMLRHPCHVRVQIACSRILATLGLSSPAAARAVAEAKGVQLLIHTILLHKESLPVSFHATRALSALVTAAPEVAPTLFQFFSVEVVVASAKTFVQDLELQKVALRLLTALAAADDGDDDAAAVRRGGQARAALRALREHRNDIEMTVEACQLLRELAAAADGETLEIMGHIGAVRMLGLVIVGYKDDEVVQIPAFAALAHLATGDEDCAHQLRAMRGAEIVLRAMRKFRNALQLRISCLLLLRTLADLDDMQALLIFTLGGLEAVFSAMIEYRQNLEIQEHAIAIIDRIVWLREDVRLKIISVGGVKTISASLRTHITNDSLVDKGVKTLRYIRYAK